MSTIGIEQALDGRWLAEAPIVPGALAYGSTRAEAAARAEALALRALAERIEYGEPIPGSAACLPVLSARHTGLHGR